MTYVVVFFFFFLSFVLFFSFFGWHWVLKLIHPCDHPTTTWGTMTNIIFIVHINILFYNKMLYKLSSEKENIGRIQFKLYDKPSRVHSWQWILIKSHWTSTFDLGRKKLIVQFIINIDMKTRIIPADCGKRQSQILLIAQFYDPTWPLHLCNNDYYESSLKLYLVGDYLIVIVSKWSTRMLQISLINLKSNKELTNS